VSGIHSLVVTQPQSERDALATKVLRAISEFEPGYVSKATLKALQELTHQRRESDESIVRLVVLHHPLSSAPRDFVGASELRNAGQVREALANAHVALAMHGHFHMHWADEVRNPLRSDWVLRTLGAAAFSGAQETEALGFNEVRIRWEGSQPRVLQRAVTRHAGAWVPGKGHEFTPGAQDGTVVVGA
jgi:hypothetical protein